jgi:hypothetical protein
MPNTSSFERQKRMGGSFEFLMRAVIKSIFSFPSSWSPNIGLAGLGGFHCQNRKIFHVDKPIQQYDNGKANCNSYPPARIFPALHHALFRKNTIEETFTGCNL